MHNYIGIGPAGIVIFFDDPPFDFLLSLLHRSSNDLAPCWQERLAPTCGGGTEAKKAGLLYNGLVLLLN